MEIPVGSRPQALGGGAAVGDVLGRGRRGVVGRLIARAPRDPQLLLTLATALPVVALESVEHPETRIMGPVLALCFLAFDVAAAAMPRPTRVMYWVRIWATLVFVVIANVGLDGTGDWPLLPLVIPIAALAAARGGAGGVAVVGASVALALVVPLLPGTTAETGERNIGTAIAALAVAVVTSRLVTTADRSLDRVRRGRRRERRRSRELAVIEEAGRLLARHGPEPITLDRVVGLLETGVGYRYPSIYLWDGALLHLAASRNYDDPIRSFAPGSGIIGRVLRTREPVFVPDVSGDPDYLSAQPGIMGEICIPMLAGEELLGVVNVESDASVRLGRDDFATMQIVADRLGAAIALGRERGKLSERASLLDRLTSFATALGATLDQSTIEAQVAAGAALVVDATIALLVRLDRATGEYRIVAMSGGATDAIGTRIVPGEGTSGRAIAAREPVVDERLPSSAFPPGLRDAPGAAAVATMAVPLLVDREVAGTLTWVRSDVSRPFSPQEQEVAVLMATKVSLALANAELHAATREASVRDPLTGLHNRRFFDAALAQADAVRGRVPPDDRTPRSAILFDLDHFGAVNNEHGHALGDQVLVRFAEAMRSRVRAGDLTARIGGEEFAVILEGATITDARRIADEIRMEFAAAPVATGGRTVGVTVSAGVAGLAREEVEGRALLDRADVALRRAKREGRDRVLVG